jgi:uncharacterized membrane protein YgcG
MSYKKLITVTALSLAMLVVVSVAPVAPKAPAQIGIGIGIAPVCPYGYYDFAPYSCSPYGYYGPDWFNGGLFIGAGPWFHGRSGFYGHVDNRYDTRNGYHGPLPERGSAPFQHFQGNEARDGNGHTGNAGHEAGGERSGGFSGGGHAGGGGGHGGGGGGRH